METRNINFRAKIYTFDSFDRRLGSYQIVIGIIVSSFALPLERLFYVLLRTLS